MTYEQESVRLTSENLKAMAHPLRVQVLGLLRTEGPATASTLAAQLGLTSGALSYHLRQLERFGFVVDDPDQGNGRDRWWRAAHRYTEFSSVDLDLDLDPSAAAAGVEYERSIITAITASLVRAQEQRPALPPAWQRAFNISDVLLRLTAAETEELGRELLALLRTYRQHTPGDEVAEDERVVEARFQVFPSAPRRAGT